MKRGCCYTFLILLVLAGVYAWNLFVSVPLKISPETTLYTEPLMDNGRNVDYLAILEANYPAEMKTDKNSARGILRQLGPGFELQLALRSVPESAFGKLRDATEAETAENYRLYYEKLGLEPITPPVKNELDTNIQGAYWQWLDAQYYDADNEKKDELGSRKIRFQRAKLQDYFTLEPEFVRQRVAQREVTLDAISEVIKDAEICTFPYERAKNECFFPFGWEYVSAEVFECELIAVDLCLRAQLRVEAGNIDGAIDDLITCIKLGRQIQKGNTSLIDFFIGIGIEKLAYSLEIATNPDAQPTAEQWERLAEFVSDPTRINSRNRGLENERLILLNDIQYGSRFNENASLLKDNFLICLGYDWNYISRREMGRFTEGLIAQNYEIFKKTVTEENQWKKILMFLTRSGRSKFWANDSRLLVLSQNDAIFWNVYHGDNLRKLGIAMQRYRLEHDGLLPPAFSVDAEGKPLHSWRVLILPYIGDEKCKELYAKIRLDEPWDSVYNKEFHDEMPEVFRCPGLDKPVNRKQVSPASETNYSVIVGENQLFDGTGTGRDYVQMMRENPTRKVEKMALITERPNSVPWMRPDAEPTTEMFTTPMKTQERVTHIGGLQAVLCNGASTTISVTRDEIGEDVLPYFVGKTVSLEK
ncbi:MAG: DUF1559 domain-containing protein [Planctomycetia bacterium]|nr:DUF1559 domain-containing protein [Planctomycetia bacterium]